MIYFGVRLYFQRKVKSKREYMLVNAQQEKLFFRLFALAFLLLALYFATPWIDFAALLLPAWLRWGGGVVTCAGIGLFAWAHQVLGKNWTAVLALSKEHVLVTDGPYRWVRHPMYSAFFTISLGFLLLSVNWLIGAIYLGPSTLMYAARISAEEQMMQARFGESYRQYMQQTGRLLPRLWK